VYFFGGAEDVKGTSEIQISDIHFKNKLIKIKIGQFFTHMKGI
jgi:hypothetical protein